MVARNQTRDKPLEYVWAIPASAVAALRPPFHQGTFGFKLLRRKEQSLKQSARKTRNENRHSDFESLNFSMLRRGVITDLACPPLEFPVVIKGVVFPKFFCRLEAYEPQAAGHRYLFLIWVDDGLGNATPRNSQVQADGHK